MWTHDLRHALRIFHREPAFAAAAVLTLTLGIGANTALFTVVQALLLRPLPFAGSERLVVIRHRDVRSGLTKPDIAIGDFIDLRARQRSFEVLSGFAGYQSTYLSDREPERVEGVVVTPDALQTLRVQPVLGRLLSADDARDGAAPVVMVSDHFWRTHLGSDPQVLSRSLHLGDERRMVAGVLPPGFRFPQTMKVDVIVPQALPANAPAQRKAGWMLGIGRLRDGETLDRAAADLAAISAELERAFPQQNQGSRYEALALSQAIVGDARRPLWLLLAAAGFVLLIACANVANLVLARQMGREQELHVRLALGASRGRLLAHVLVEACTLALAGGAAGVSVAWATAPLVSSLLPNAATLPGLEQVGVDWGVLLFATGAALFSALVVSTIAWVGQTMRPGTGWAGGRRRTMTPAAQRASSALVAGEIALAIVLLAGAGLTTKSFGKLLAVDPGFTPASVLTVEFSLPASRYRHDEARRAFYARAFENVAALPDVEAIGAAMVTPLTGNNWTVPLQRLDRPVPRGERPPEIGWQLASAGYFHALRIPLRAGRLFDAGDATGAPVVILSQAVVDRFFTGENPLGRRINLGDMTAEIVGIVGDIRRGSLTDGPRADLYFPFERVMSPSTSLFVRTKGDPMRILPALGAALRRLEPHGVLFQARTMQDIAEESAAATRLAARLLVCCAVIALALATVGVYGMMAYRVRRRTRELGTRLALGARPEDITRLVLRQAAVIAVTGVVAGSAAAVLFARTLSSLLFDVAPWDPVTLASAVALLGLATLLGSYLPARRAARVDPAMVLEVE